MWNFGDIFSAVADAADQAAPAFIHEGQVTAWPEAADGARALAQDMLAHDVRPGEKVAFYLRNGPAYAQAAAACFIAGLVHVNVNYRYGANEVRHILQDSDAVVVLHDPEFGPLVDEIAGQLPKLRVVVEAATSRPGQRQTYTARPMRAASRPADDAGYPDAEILIYTGGTTGMPKGVIFRQHELAPYLFASSGLFGEVPPQSLDDVAALVRRQGVSGRRYLVACPQMHSTGLFVTMWTMLTGGCVVTVGGRSLDADAIWRAAADGRATNLAIVGDPFARPLLAALDAAPGRYDLSALVGIGSSGAMWSAEIKQGLLRHLPHVLLTDVYASTETMGGGVSVIGQGAPVQTASFALGPDAIVIDEEDRPMRPGTQVPGRLAVGGMQPVGYYKDAEKTARAFRTIGGQRYSIPGDYALLEADGIIKLLGRGSGCINTAGEKVFAEEVEEVLKTHHSVTDALVVGLPDPVWGSAVTAAVRLKPDHKLDEQGLRDHVRARLASYKVPKRILEAGPEMRAPNGKADYKAVTAHLLCHVPEARTK